MLDHTRTWPPVGPEIKDLIHVRIDEWRETLDFKIDTLHRAINGIDDPRDVLEALPRIDPPPQFGPFAVGDVASGVGDVVTALQSLATQGFELLDQLRNIAT